MNVRMMLLRLFLLCIVGSIFAFQKIHVVTQIDLINQTEEALNSRVDSVKRFYSSLYAFSSFHEAYDHIDYHLCIFYDSSSYFQSNLEEDNSYFTYLSDRYHPNPQKFPNSLHTRLLNQFNELGLSLIYIPSEEISIFPERYLIDDNRVELLNLLCGLYVGRQLLTDPLYSDYAQEQSKSSDSFYQNIFNFYQSNPSISQQFFDYVLFVHSNYVISNNHLIRYLTNNRTDIASQFDFHCFPYSPVLSNINPSIPENITSASFLALLDGQQRLYDLNLYYLKIQAAIPLLLYFQSSLMSNSQSISTILQRGINSLSTASSLRLMHEDRDNVRRVHAKRMYLIPPGIAPNSIEEILSISLIEFDDDFHKFYLDYKECSLQLHVTWPMYNTVQIIQGVLNHYLKNNDTRWNHLTYCQPICFNKKCHKNDEKRVKLTKIDELIQNSLSPNNPHFFYNELLLFNQLYLNKDNNLKIKQFNKDQSKTETTSSISNDSLSLIPLPRIFDCVLFFNEISLLRLRLSLLSKVVHKSLILESHYTFTGKRKRLILSENLSLFSEFHDKMDIIILDHVPYPTPEKVGQIWANEYYSRNFFHKILKERYNIQSNDIILLGDTDEIIDPDIIILLSSMFYYSYYFTSLSLSSNEMMIKDQPLRLKNIYKILLSEYSYDFDCYFPSLTNRFPSARSVAIGTYETALQYTERMLLGKDNLFYSMRMFLQYDSLVPSEYLMRGYVWHLSYFQLSSEQLKTKLESFSHHNIASMFFTQQNEEEEGIDQEKEEVGKRYQMKNEDSLLQGMISLEKIEEKIQRKKLINEKHMRENHPINKVSQYLHEKILSDDNSDYSNEECSVRDTDVKSEIIQSLWKRYHLSFQNLKVLLEN